MSEIPIVIDLGECRNAALAGGKAVNLARLMGAGFPVPDGFAVTTLAFRKAASEPGGVDSIPPAIAAEILLAYGRMGRGLVAVRSSATAEDLADASMAGQYDTFLSIEGDEQVLDAVKRCWQSLSAERVQGYLSRNHIDPSSVAMGVVVQRQVRAELSGVLFTVNPQFHTQGEMLIEATWGLGEGLVSGLVQPDTLVVDRATGAIKQSTIGSKKLRVTSSGSEPEETPEELRSKPCLNSRTVFELWKLGLQVMDHFGSGQDIEWALQDGHLYLLQTRAITTLEEIEVVEHLLKENRQQLRSRKETGMGDWALHNIAETLPHPTPLTWKVIGRFMSGEGGFGRMYRKAGYDPAPSVQQRGFLDLIGGRPYMDLSLAGEMFFENYPYAYDPELLRQNPNAAQEQPTISKGTAGQRRAISSRLQGVQRRLQEISRDFDQKLDGEIIPALQKYVREEKQRDLKALTTQEWLQLWKEREEQVLTNFGCDLMLPSLIGAMASSELRAFLAIHFWDEEPDQLLQQLSTGSQPDQTVLSNDGLRRVGTGEWPVEQWLVEFGHRAPSEFDLATPRWREQPELLAQMAARVADGGSPLQRHSQHQSESKALAERLEQQLSSAQRSGFRQHLDLAHRYLRFREDGKHYLMLGYDLLRDMALEAGRRLEIGRDVFLLNFEELQDALTTGFAPLHLISQRRLQRSAESRLDLPRVITGEDIESLGLPRTVDASANAMKAFPISGGVAAGPVRLVLTPEAAGTLGRDYVLVCPSTDPGWTPLFAGAAALVLEKGGALSHGAIVAREMGIPAVVLDDATRILSEAEWVTVDGQNGLITRGETDNRSPAPNDAAPADSDMAIPPAKLPPPPGPMELSNGRWMKRMLAVWALFFLLLWLLPATWLYQPVLKFIDLFLLPLVVAIGRPWTVAMVAIAMATYSILGQRLLTDNERLLVEKKRSDSLRKEAAALPEDSPRRVRLQKAARPVQGRILQAALYPLVLILGPMVMLFLWFPERIDPMSWNPRPGASAYVTAVVDGDYDGPVGITLDERLLLDERSPVEQTVPQFRPVLQELLDGWRQSSALPDDLPWQVQAAAVTAREALLADLGAYLRNPMPEQQIAWSIHTPVDSDGRYRIAVAAGENPPLISHLTTGDRVAPEPKEFSTDGRAPAQVVTGSEGNPVRSIRVAYRSTMSKEDLVFWRPVEWLAGPLLPGWLLVYLFVYLPVMLILKRLLKVA